MVSFEIFVKAMRPRLSELKVLPSFCFALKIPDDVAASNMYHYLISLYILIILFSKAGLIENGRIFLMHSPGTQKLKILSLSEKTRPALTCL